MKMCFFTGHKFAEKDGKIYTTGSLNNTVLGRYNSMFEDVMVCARKTVSTGAVMEDNYVTCVSFKLFGRKIPLWIQKSEIERIVIDKDRLIMRVPSLIGFMAIKYAKKYNKPYLVELVGCPWDAYWNHSFAGKILAPLIWWLTKKTVKSTDYVLYVSEKFLQGRYPTNGKSIACSDVQLNEFNEQVFEKRLDKIKTLKDRKEIVISTVAAINVKYKGQQYVIKALSKLKKDGYSIKYKLVGGGDKTYLQNIAKKYNVLENVEFCGPVSHDQIFEFLDNIDLYIQPSNLEGLPRAVVEAMSRACPVIGSNVGGIPELIDEKYLFKKKNTNDICDKIKNMLSEENMLAEARRSFNRATDFDIDKLNVKRNEFYTKFKNESEKING